MNLIVCVVASSNYFFSHFVVQLSIVVWNGTWNHVATSFTVQTTPTQIQVCRVTQVHCVSQVYYVLRVCYASGMLELWSNYSAPRRKSHGSTRGNVDHEFVIPEDPRSGSASNWFTRKYEPSSNKRRSHGFTTGLRKQGLRAKVQLVCVRFARKERYVLWVHDTKNSLKL